MHKKLENLIFFENILIFCPFECENEHSRVQSQLKEKCKCLAKPKTTKQTIAHTFQDSLVLPATLWTKSCTLDVRRVCRVHSLQKTVASRRTLLLKGFPHHDEMGTIILAVVPSSRAKMEVRTMKFCIRSCKRIMMV